MAAAVSSIKKVSLPPVIVAALAALALGGGLIYLNRPVSQTANHEAASPEARAYVRHLQLSDVKMTAAENFMKQQLIEVEGDIRNNGPRALQGVDVYCLFYNVNGQQIYREKMSIVQSKGVPLRPGEGRAFRLAFDTLPDGWNQAVPRMVIAQIAFAR